MLLASLLAQPIPSNLPVTQNIYFNDNKGLAVTQNIVAKLRSKNIFGAFFYWLNR